MGSQQRRTEVAQCEYSEYPSDAPADADRVGSQPGRAEPVGCCARDATGGIVGLRRRGFVRMGPGMQCLMGRDGARVWARERTASEETSAKANKHANARARK